MEEFEESNIIKVIELDHSIIVGNDYSVFTTITLCTSTIGILLSAASIVLLILTACLFEEWRKSYKNQLLIQLILTRFIYNFTRYFSDIRRLTQFCERYECIVYLDTYFMIYTEIAVVGWMFVFTKQMYDSLVKVFVERPNIWKMSFSIQGFALFLALIIYISYGWRSDGLKPTFFFFYLGLLKWPVLLLNAVMLITILKAIIKSNESKENRSNKRPIAVMILLIFTLCFHQMLIDIYKIIIAYYNLPAWMLVAVNTITMYHATFSVIFWVFGNETTRKMWRDRTKDCCCKSKDVEISSASNEISKESVQCYTIL